MNFEDQIVRKYRGQDVIVACKVRHTSGVSVFYFVHNKDLINGFPKLSFNFILN